MQRTWLILVVVMVVCVWVGGCHLFHENQATQDTTQDTDVYDRTDPDLDSDGENDVVSACEQETPWCSETPPTEICDSYPDDHCAITGCGDCQVCYVDFSCGPPGPDGIIGSCSCSGDGDCYDLCAGDEDCGTEEDCTDARWFCGYDAPNQLLHICWPRANPPFGH